MPRTLDRMNIVITGASAGIGSALARELSRAGARLVLAARRFDKLEELNQSLGGRHVSVRCDVSVPHDCEQLIALADARLGRIDTLVCNAGYGFVSPVAEMSAEQMRAIFATNVFGTTDCIRAAVEIMREQEAIDGFRGQVVIVSSAAARRGLPMFGAYSATKAAQLSLAESLRVELRGRGIAVTSVQPVGTRTDFFTSAEQVSGRRFETEHSARWRQPVEHVVRRIVAAIRRPRPEVWPSRITRWLLPMSIFMPRLTDWAMSRYLREIEALTPPGGTSTARGGVRA
jgi:short-subunit dehydrogenase